MNTQAKVLIAILMVGVVGLGTALSVVIANGDGESGTSNRGMMNGDDGFAGMMGAMGSMDPDAMLTHMRDVLGEGGYRGMLDHWRDHRNGGAMTSDPAIDEMMHRMIDGMIEHMPQDRDGLLPPNSDRHHKTPGAGMTPRP